MTDAWSLIFPILQCVVLLSVVQCELPGRTRCFDQQYSTLEIDLKAVVTVQKLAILAPIGIYHVHTEISDGVFSQMMQKNGRPMVLYSSLTAGNAEWLTCSVIARRIRLVAVFSKQEKAPVSVYVSACRHETDIIAMDDRSFYVDSRSAGLVSMYENVLSVVFRTFSDGIFLFSGAEQGDLLVAQITAGRVFVIFDFGSLSYMEISGGNALNDGAWHELRWVHEFDSVELIVDGVLENSTNPTGLYRKLDFHTEIEIGGRPFDAQSNTIQSSFRGCLASVMLNNVELLSFAPKDTYGPCSLPHYQMITISENGSISVPYSFLPLAFEFRVLPRPGVFLDVLGPKNESLFVLQFDKNMSVEMNANSTFINHISQPDVKMDDGSWHSMIFNIRNGRLEVEIDGVTVIWLEGSIVRTIALKMTTFRLSAAGCYRSTTVSLRSAHVSGLVHLDKCVYESKCRPRTCENGGNCLQTSLSDFRCECAEKHKGTYCHTSLHPRSCEEFFRTASRKKQRLNVTIDIDGGGPLRPFTVLCERSTSNETNKPAMIKTILHHDLTDGLLVSGPTEPGAIRRPLSYRVDTAQMDRFIDGFEQCEQWMSFTCHGGSRLMTFGNERRPSSWYSTRNGQHGLQWGDAPPYSRMCSCAMNSSCTYNRMCNCDSGNDGVDEGYNNHKHLLPVMHLYVGGTTLSSSSTVVIGPLSCSHRVVNDALVFLDRNKRIVGSQTFHSTTFDIYAHVRFRHPRVTIFTWESTNGQRWFQLFSRGGRLVGQIVNGGRIWEIESAMIANDNEWHTVYWEVDESSARLSVDDNEVSTTIPIILPSTYTWILGSRSEQGRDGYAGMIRSMYLNGKEVAFSHYLRDPTSTSIVLGESGACRSNSCQNDGFCEEYYDSFKCNCSMTPFAGNFCEQEVGASVSKGSQISIPWQHPAHVSNCYRVAIQTTHVGVSILRSRALFADSSLNISLTAKGFLNVNIFDGFFFRHNMTSSKSSLADNRLKDIAFCANKHEFRLTINGKPSVVIAGNFTFFNDLNVWHFIDKNFTGCLTRLQIGTVFPLKERSKSRLTYQGNMKFDSCPYDKMLRSVKSQTTAKPSNISVSTVIDSIGKVRYLTPAMLLIVLCGVTVSICLLSWYVCSRPDGVYETNENLSAFCTPSKSVEPLVVDTFQKEYFC